MKRNRLKWVLSWALTLCMLLGMTVNIQAQPDEEPAAVSKAVWEKVEDSDLVPERIAKAEESASSVRRAPAKGTQDETVRVFIIFDKEAVVDKGFALDGVAGNKSAMAYAKELKQEQDAVLAKVNPEIEIDARYSFTLLSNAVSAEVLRSQIDEITNTEGVAAVVEAPVYELTDKDEAAQPNTVTAGEMNGSFTVWGNGYTGAGMRVAIIDTGLDTDHPSFDAAAFRAHLDEVLAQNGKTLADVDLMEESDIAAVESQLNAYAAGGTAEEKYRTEKVPYAFNYVDSDLDVTHDHDTQGDHGTHVAGIAAANYYVPTADGFARQANGVAGVAPDAQLLIMKVFGKGGGAYSDDYVAAIEDAILLGADSINLSLGSASAGETAAGEAYIDEVFDKLSGTNTVVSISAGNSGSWGADSQYGANLTKDVNLDTVGSPGSYTNSFTVASANNIGYTGYAAIFGTDYEVYYNESDYSNEPFHTLDTTGNGTEFDYVLINGAGEESDYEGLDVTGKIVLVSRGVTTFAEKHMAAEAAGAIGVFIYNNQAGTLGLNLTGSTATIPCVSITQAEGEAVKSQSEKVSDKVYTGKVTINGKVSTTYEVADGNTMSSFSSWGVPGDLTLKPEITAAGGNIYSTLNGGTYGQMSGTSMAAPSIAGLSALMIQYIEENDLAAKSGLTSRALAQSLLMSTAKLLTDEEGKVYSPRRQGAGFANISAATQSPVYILMGDGTGSDGKVKAELGDDPDRNGVYSFDFTAYSLDGKPAFYSPDSLVMTETVADDYYIGESPYVLSPEVTFDGEVLLYDLNEDGTVDVKDALYFLQNVNKSVASAHIQALGDALDFNNDGCINTLDVALFAKMIKSGQGNFTEKGYLVDGSAHVKVTVTLSDADKQYLNDNFANGMYVEGYAYLKGAVELSVPFLAFYGNWTDASMYENYDYMDATINKNIYNTYSGISETNYMKVKFHDASADYPFVGNFYADDDEYLPERNAISSVNGDSISKVVFTLIRNAADLSFEVKDAETGVVYESRSVGAATAEYYHSNQGKWMNTQLTYKAGWQPVDAEGNPLADGTKLTVGLKALPSYYADGSKTPGEGVYLTFPVTIDNEAPVLVNNPELGETMDIVVKDNQYTAAVLLVDVQSRAVLGRYAVNQTEAGVESTITVSCPESIFYIVLVDYAGNTSLYRYNNSGEPDTPYANSIVLSDSEVELLKGSSYALTAEVGPISLLDPSVTWSSSDETVATVDADGVVTAVSVGSAVITATTKALNKEGGEPLTAECAVNVFELTTQIKGMVWDENADVHVAQFGVSSPAAYNTLAVVDGHYIAGTKVGDKLYAIISTDDDNQTADMYTIDPANGYAEERLGESGQWYTDMAYNPATNQILGLCGFYVSIYDVEAQEDIGAFDLSDYAFGSDYLVGIDYVGTDDAGNSYFYAITQSGVLYVFIETASMNLRWGTMGNTEIETYAFYNNSLLYDAESGYLYYSMWNKDESVLYGIDIDGTGSIYTLGDFGADVWPVAGLYTDAKGTAATISSVADEILSEGEAVEMSAEKPVKLDVNAVTRTNAQ